jgi:hypothetical protein
MTAERGEPGAAPALVPAQVKGTVLTARRVDAYHAITVIAPGVAARFRPGQFVAVSVGGPDGCPGCGPGTRSTWRARWGAPSRCPAIR